MEDLWDMCRSHLGDTAEFSGLFGQTPGEKRDFLNTRFTIPEDLLVRE
jgi:hypothetical protein